ncbi:acetyl-CoA carboxylase biotin carboxylase subunit [Shewanella sp. AS16]|uniref:acetyl-CoA carboxylase biotin carboxylase subunit n=1 Tax=Shewanella sp. AS16 TaxID=2907625 RepID=UPI001F164EB7|nr:acetyl-CoA carboxylase biotin carboxylase subunit [Shewanella sp. AS16]MCE9687653.1 acetyl-CoA carboxylase biotin carboxylase subunit [Shewanella sp. AS16]
MLKKVVIANRGEIALRILRACRELGIQTVALYSSADKTLPHVALADESYCIGPPAAKDSYLKANAIISVADLSGADAIHPGYGFLAEDADFAELVERCGLNFIGPGSEVIRLLGDKVSALALMRQAGVPTLPGSDAALGTDAEANLALARRLGYPVIIKAAGGGGGKGMRQVWEEAELLQAIALTQAEAAAAFNNPVVYMEKFLQQPRHIEFQLLADGQGKAIYLGERDCSMQRQQQKVTEEAPAPGIDERQRRDLGERCVRACLEVGYRGVGTFEFLYQDGEFYFIEVNTRIQVEHPLTEMITGVDLLKQQLRIASGEPLSLSQADIQIRGHAIECRINAEAGHSFLPSPGQIRSFNAPGGNGVRWDSQLYAGYRVPPHYDSLIGKLICHGDDRASALAKMRQALSELKITGIATNIGLQQEIMRDDNFIAGGCNIHYLEHMLGLEASR